MSVVNCICYYNFRSRSVTHNRHTVIQFAHSNLNVRQPYLTNCLRNDVIKITPPSTQYGLHGLIQRSNVALNPVEFSRNPTVNNTNCTMILNNTQYHLYSIPLSPIQRVPINPITVIRSVPNRSDQANVNEVRLIKIITEPQRSNNAIFIIISSVQFYSRQLKFYTNLK